MKKYLSMFAFVLTGALMFVSCDDDGDSNEPTICPAVISDGLYVVNEGSFYKKINGSLDYLDYKTWKATRNIFQSTNGRSLGGTPNNAVINERGEMYIATTDENRVEIVNPKTTKSIAVAKIRQPRELAIDNGCVYVSSYTGKVYKIDSQSYKVVDSSKVVGANLEGIATTNGYVYVCNSHNPDYTYNTNVVKLDKQLDKVKDVKVLVNPTQILALNNELFVISIGNYKDINPTVQQIDIKTDHVSVIGAGTMMAAGTDRLYIINSPWGKPATYNAYDLTNKTMSKWVDGSEILYPYGVGVDPITGDVFVTSQNKDAVTGRASYVTDGYLARYTRDGNFKGKYPCGVNPGTIVFLNHQE